MGLVECLEGSRSLTDGLRHSGHRPYSFRMPESKADPFPV